MSRVEDIPRQSLFDTSAAFIRGPALRLHELWDKSESHGWQVRSTDEESREQVIIGRQFPADILRAERLGLGRVKVSQVQACAIVVVMLIRQLPSWRERIEQTMNQAR